jgi:hypothetical protein
VLNSSGEASLADGERRLRRFLPFSDGIKACLGQVGVGGCLAVLLWGGAVLLRAGCSR